MTDDNGPHTRTEKLVCALISLACFLYAGLNILSDIFGVHAGRLFVKALFRLVGL